MEFGPTSFPKSCMRQTIEPANELLNASDLYGPSEKFDLML